MSVAMIEEPAPPEGIMPAEKSNGSLVPSQTVIERLRLMSNDVAASGLGIGGCRTPGAAFYKMMLGWEHGIRPMTALSAINIIEGHGCLSAQALAASVEARGLGRIDIQSVDDDGCTVNVTCADRGPDWYKLVVYSKQDAAAAGFLKLEGGNGAVIKDAATGAAISGKKNWRTNHQDMYVARAIARAYRRWFRVATLGVAYTVEEMQDGSDEVGRPIAVELDKPRPSWQSESSLESASSKAPPGDPAEGDGAHAVAPAAAAQGGRTPLGPPVGVTTDACIAPPVARIIPDPLAETVRSLLKELKVSQSDWKTILKQWKVASLREMLDPEKAAAIEFLKTIRWIRQIRGCLSIPDAQWDKVVAKRCVARDLDLSLDQARELYANMADRLTPFDRQRLGI